MKKRTILIVPPRGIPIKTIRVRLSVAITVILILLIGFLGYIIPFNSSTLNVVETNQKKNLSEQNNALLRKILSTLKLLNDLKDQVNRLEIKQKNAAQFSGLGDNAEISKNSIDFHKLGTEELLRYVENRELLFQSVYNKISKKNLFDSIPVIYPIQDSFVVSRGYGPAVDPFTLKNKWHYGVDFVSQEGVKILATASGVVTRLENHPIWGIRVEIEHGGGFRTIYAHLGQASITKGKWVKKGQVIGKMGLSGLSTGMHLHYEVIHNNQHINPKKMLFPTLQK